MLIMINADQYYLFNHERMNERKANNIQKYLNFYKKETFSYK